MWSRVHVLLLWCIDWFICLGFHSSVHHGASYVVLFHNLLALLCFLMQYSFGYPCSGWAMAFVQLHSWCLFCLRVLSSFLFFQFGDCEGAPCAKYALFAAPRLVNLTSVHVGFLVRPSLSVHRRRPLFSFLIGRSFRPRVVLRFSGVD